MERTKITGLTALNVRAIRETIPVDLGVSTTATTATFSMDAPSALALVEATIARLPGRGHPRQSLHAVRRKLGRLAVPRGPISTALRGPVHRLNSEGHPVGAYDGEPLEL